MPQITLTISEKNEGTAAPYWLIIDPKQMMRPDAFNVADMITGPFFSREEATEHLASRPHAFSSKAIVYCHSGHASIQYKLACRGAGLGC